MSIKISAHEAKKREEAGRKFRRLIVSVAGRLRQNNPELSQDEAYRKARDLVKTDWKETKKVLK